MSRGTGAKSQALGPSIVENIPEILADCYLMRSVCRDLRFIPRPNQHGNKKKEGNKNALLGDNNTASSSSTWNDKAIVVYVSRYPDTLSDGGGVLYGRVWSKST